MKRTYRLLRHRFEKLRTWASAERKTSNVCVGRGLVRRSCGPPRHSKARGGAGSARDSHPTGRRRRLAGRESRPICSSPLISSCDGRNEVVLPKLTLPKSLMCSKLQLSNPFQDQWLKKNSVGVVPSKHRNT